MNTDALVKLLLRYDCAFEIEQERGHVMKVTLKKYIEADDLIHLLENLKSLKEFGIYINLKCDVLL